MKDNAGHTLYTKDKSIWSKNTEQTEVDGRVRQHLLQQAMLSTSMRFQLDRSLRDNPR